MAYKVLYRKYRPDSFDKIVGQDNIINILKNSIINKNFSHAYIFTGPRGTGKTSTAKILAKAINCETPINGEPCGKCNSCVNANTSPDIIEIDAASNNGVDEIRELRSNVTLAPALTNYKVYIIDEVHMLSTGAFNALLKTLEEPPSHAIFILATTEIYKVPITILSRCQRYDFKKIEKKSMLSYLNTICQKENIICNQDALEEIYSLSDGCLRDALSILDQLSKISENINLDLILENYNIISNKTIDSLIEQTFNGNVNEILSKLNRLEETGMNSQKLIKKIICYLEQLAINIKLKQENRYDFSKIKKLISLLNECYVESRINENTFTMIILAFLEMVPDVDSPKVTSFESLKNEKKVITEPNNIVDIRINNCFVSANKMKLTELSELWSGIDKNKLKDIDIKEYTPVASSEEYAIFKSEDSSLVDLFNVKSETITKFLKKMKMNLKVVAVTETTWLEAKKKYKENIQKGYTYRFIDEIKENIKQEKTDNFKEEINDIFENKIVEIS